MRDAKHAAPATPGDLLFHIRASLSGIALPEGVQPAHSHVALNQITDANGEERDIVRFNLPFGRVGAADPAGNLFFVPSTDFLDEPPPSGPGPGNTVSVNPITSTDATTALIEPVAVVDDEGSLGIGSLKGV